MNKHLKLVREFHDALSFPQAEAGGKYTVIRNANYYASGIAYGGRQ